jgi:hypothetical protein
MGLLELSNICLRIPNDERQYFKFLGRRGHARIARVTKPGVTQSAAGAHICLPSGYILLDMPITKKFRIPAVCSAQYSTG